MTTNMQINDKGAVQINTGTLPVSYLSHITEIAKTGAFTAGGVTHRGSSLLNPFYQDPAMFVFGNNDKVFDGEAAIVIANTLPCAVDVTRAHRDGGYMKCIPFDGVSTTNTIPGARDIAGQGYFGVGGYYNEKASMYYGAGAVLYLTPKDPAYPKMAIGYCGHINGGYGLDAHTDATSIPDAKAWFQGPTESNNQPSGSYTSQRHAKLEMHLSVANSAPSDNNSGGVWCCLLQPK